MGFTSIHCHLSVDIDQRPQSLAYWAGGLYRLHPDGTREPMTPALLGEMCRDARAAGRVAAFPPHGCDNLKPDGTCGGHQPMPEWAQW